MTDKANKQIPEAAIKITPRRNSKASAFNNTRWSLNFHSHDTKLQKNIIIFKKWNSKVALFFLAIFFGEAKPGQWYIMDSWHERETAASGNPSQLLCLGVAGRLNRSVLIALVLRSFGDFLCFGLIHDEPS